MLRSRGVDAEVGERLHCVHHSTQWEQSRVSLSPIQRGTEAVGKVMSWHRHGTMHGCHRTGFVTSSGSCCGRSCCGSSVETWGGTSRGTPAAWHWLPRDVSCPHQSPEVIFTINNEQLRHNDNNHHLTVLYPGQPGSASTMSGTTRVSWLSSFLTAHQHITGHCVPLMFYGEIRDIKRMYNQGC